MNARFPRVSRRRKGYSPRQVDAFLNHIEVSLSGVFPPPTAQEVREAGFELVRHGYDTAAVDSHLDLLEERILLLQQRVSGRRRRSDTDADVTFLRTELSQPYMKRFPRTGALHRGYDVDQVDEFLDRVVAALDGAGNGQGPSAVDVEDVRTVSFRPRRGGYDEDVVDETLDRVVELLLLLRHRAGEVRTTRPGDHDENPVRRS